VPDKELEQHFEEYLDSQDIFSITLPVCSISSGLYANLWAEFVEKASPFPKTAANFIRALNGNFLALDVFLGWGGFPSTLVREAIYDLHERLSKFPPTTGDQHLLSAYFGEGCTLPELRKLHLSANLTLGDRFAVLHLFLLYWVLRYAEHPENHCGIGHVLLQINGIDHLFSSSKEDVAHVAGFLHYALDDIPGLIVWLNTSVTGPFLMDSIQQALGSLLSARIHAKICPGAGWEG
jgi:hypothetical protein